MICAAVEAATGASRIADAALSLREATALAAFAFSFGGLCIMAQSMIFMRIDIKKYLICKLAQGMLARADSVSVVPSLLQWYAKRYRRAGNNGNIRAKQPFRPCYTCLLDGGNGSGNAYLRRKSKVGKAEKRRY